MIMPGRSSTRVSANGANAQSKKGRLLIFPAWLKHTVPANDESERISISFNLMFNLARRWRCHCGTRRGQEKG